MDVLQLPELHGLASDESTQSRERRERQNQTQKEQSRITSLQGGVEKPRMRIDEDLQHQDRRCDQQHIGHRGEQCVAILNRLIDPAFEKPCGDAQCQGQGHDHQGGEGANDKGRSDALQGQQEHRVARLVGSQDMVVSRQGDDPHNGGTDQKEAECCGFEWPREPW